MATKGVTVTIRGRGADVVAASSSVAGIDAIQAGSLANITAAVATAQITGAGDASADIDTIDTNVQALTTALQAVENGTTGAVVVQVDTAVTKNQLRVALDAAFDYFARSLDVLT